MKQGSVASKCSDALTEPGWILDHFDPMTCPLYVCQNTLLKGVCGIAEVCWPLSSPFLQFLSAEIDSVKGEKVPQMQIPESEGEEETLRVRLLLMRSWMNDGGQSGNFKVPCGLSQMGFSASGLVMAVESIS